MGGRAAWRSAWPCTGHSPAGRWRRAWEIAYPRPFPEIVSAAVQQSGTPLSLAYAIMREESAFDPEAVSPAGAHGLMQLIWPTVSQLRVSKAVRQPSRAAANAASRPAWPAPTTITSKW